MIPALVTPFRDDERIDYAAWQVIIDTLIAAGLDGLFVGGSQGEFCTLDYEERHVSIRFCRQAAAGRVPVYANVGCVTTAETVSLAHQAEAIGVDAIVVITPYYLKPTQDELVEHYTEVCRSVRLPALAYNFPQHGGVEILPETLARIAGRCENLLGIKDSGGSLERAIAYRTCVPDREMAVFVGPEHLVLAALDAGCAGCVAACANIAPRVFVELYRAFREGRRADAERLHALAAELSGWHALHTFPSPVKEAMRIIGFSAGPCRKPVGPMPPEARQKLTASVKRLDEEGWLAHAHESAREREKSVPAPARS
jgi:4-hydroxy-tetrahydrodipicolinate synthase